MLTNEPNRNWPCQIKTLYNLQNHLLNDVKYMHVYIWDMHDFEPVWIIKKLKLCTQFLF